MKNPCLVFLGLFLLVQANPIEEDFSNGNPMLGKHFQGDIAGFNYAPDQMLKGVAQIPNSKYGLWPGGRIPYKFSTATEQQTIINGMKMIESSTCIRFYPATSADSVYLNIISGNGCYSSVGRQSKAGPQELSLQKGGCIHAGIAAHELLHAIGFNHEQCRPDRDNYLTINWNNIATDKRFNFDKVTNSDTLGYPYDYNSVMHYSGTAFSINGQPTMVPKKAGVVLISTYKKTALSPIDAAEVKTLYKCSTG